MDELEKMPEVAAYYAVWNDLRDTLEGYYKNRPRQHNPLSQQKEFRAIKNAIIQEAERLRQQMSRNLHRAKNRLRKKLLETLLQIRRLQMKILRPQPLILCGFHPSIC